MTGQVRCGSNRLHGRMVGLDVCPALHMDVSLNDPGWCIDQIMPAKHGYLMALPTRIDLMLGYLTAGYQGHVHVRENFAIQSERPDVTVHSDAGCDISCFR